VNTPAHTFPLPLAETAKLETVTGELHHHEPYKKLTDYLRAKPWHCLFIVALLGVLTGLFARSRKAFA
jgi:hypothetical protein